MSQATAEPKQRTFDEPAAKPSDGQPKTDVQDLLHEVLERTSANRMREIVRTGQKYHDLLANVKEEWDVTCVMAAATTDISELLTKDVVENVVMKLMDKEYGFRTDRERSQQKYSWPEIKNAVLHAIMQGYRLYGNEFNIIKGGFMPVLNGLERKVREFPGIIDPKVLPAKPTFDLQNKPPCARVPVTASFEKTDGTSWKLTTTQGKEEVVIDIELSFDKSNKVVEGIDNVKSKAARRVWGHIFKLLTKNYPGLRTAHDVEDDLQAASEAAPEFKPALEAKPFEGLTSDQITWLDEQFGDDGGAKNDLLSALKVSNWHGVPQRFWRLLRVIVDNRVRPAWLCKHVFGDGFPCEMSDEDIQHYCEWIPKEYKK